MHVSFDAWIKKPSILIFNVIYLYVFLDLQQLIELGAELKKHCSANDLSCELKVGEPSCAMFPGEAAVLVAGMLTEESFVSEFMHFCCAFVPVARR